MPQNPTDTMLFSGSEIDWFCRCSYNLALKSCVDWPPVETIRLVRAFFQVQEMGFTNSESHANDRQFAGLYPEDTSQVILTELSQRRLSGEFLVGSLLVVLAREEDSQEKHVIQFSTLSSPKLMVLRIVAILPGPTTFCKIFQLSSGSGDD